MLLCPHLMTYIPSYFILSCHIATPHLSRLLSHCPVDFSNVYVSQSQLTRVLIHSLHEQVYIGVMSLDTADYSQSYMYVTLSDW